MALLFKSVSSFFFPFSFLLFLWRSYNLVLRKRFDPENYNQLKCRAQSQRIQNTPTPQAPATVCKRETGRSPEPKNRGVCCETMSPNNVRKSTHTVLSQHETNKLDSNRCAEVGKEKPTGLILHKESQTAKEHPE